jgi:hypothetical protein
MFVCILYHTATIKVGTVILSDSVPFRQNTTGVLLRRCLSSCQLFQNGIYLKIYSNLSHKI